MIDRTTDPQIRKELAENLRRLRREIKDKAYARAFCRAVLANFYTGLAAIPVVKKKPVENSKGSNMPYFRVVEVYPQAVVRRELIVRAPSKEAAENEPHAQEFISEGYDIDEGGEAYTESCERVSKSDADPDVRRKGEESRGR